MNRILATGIFMLLFTVRSEAQNKPVFFEDLKELQARDERPVVVLVMTSWCKYCHAMKQIMLNHKKVSQILGSEYYTVFLDAEGKKDISFAGKNFKHKNGVHELARELGTIEGQVSYPTLCVLNSENEILYQHNGYLSPGALSYTFKKIAEKEN
jgi:thioredoxin-related protein